MREATHRGAAWRAWAAALAVAAALALVAAPLAAQEPVVIDLDRAVALALAQNPALAAAEERRTEVAAQVREVKADAWPQLSGTGSYAVSRNPSLLNSPDFEDILEQFPGGEFRPGEQRLYSAGVEFSQPVYTFGKIGAAIELARVAVDATEAQIAAARLDVALTAAETYYDVLATREALAVGRVQTQVRQQALEVVEARYEIGEATRLELLRAEAALAEVEPTVVQLAGDVEVAESRLRRALGLPPGAPVAIEGVMRVTIPPELASPPSSLPSAPPPAPPSAQPAPRPATGAPPAVAHAAVERPPAPPPLPALTTAALAGRPELLDLALQQEALERRVTVTRAEARPQVELNGFLGRQVRLFENFGESLYDDYALSLGLRWEFFDGGRRAGQIAQFESQRRQIALQREDLAAEIRLDLEEALTAYRTALARWEAAESAAAAAREASRVAKDSYEEGVALQSDWLDAQRQETETEILAVDAYYDARREAARLARAVGTVPSERWPSAALLAAAAQARSSLEEVER